MPWYQFSCAFETSEHIMAGDLNTVEVAEFLFESLESRGFPIRHIDQLRIDPIKTEQESRLAHPSNNPI